ncbi:MAG: 4Fe-4S dicluster domain-containing protein [bacterium]|nr:4Fe-4S dicluster domain-containing protein [bacterium]
MTTQINVLLLALTDVMLMVFLVASVREKEPRAAWIAFGFLPANSCFWPVFIFWGHVPYVVATNIAVFVFIALFGLFSLLRFFPKRKPADTSQLEQADERDSMFVRNMLGKLPEQAKSYYASRPENRDVDEKIHEKPELGEPGHTYYDTYDSPIFDAAFQFLARIRDISEGETAAKQEIDRGILSDKIRDIARFYGAVDVAITPLKTHHYYSHVGRDPERFGEEISDSHTHAVVIVVAMDVATIKSAPDLPVIHESSRQYVESAKIAHIIAHYIRNFGYDARSHVDQNYRVLCVPLAVDAGLGALGRMGVFMHPVHGPCVRISVVTTDLELVSPPLPKASEQQAMEHFCLICKKCADNCPTQSINREEEPVSRGFRHWSIRQETCFSYWKTVGTDCGFCIRVCPYTKPDTFIHKLVRFYISRNSINQRLALLMDDFFYGRKIPIKK